jgi:ribosomal protein RSM22 (predicted rRNA methylase)
MELPHQLRAAVEAETQTLSPGRLAQLAQGITARYRAPEVGAGRQFLVTSDDVSAYAAFRLPATFAAVKAALAQAAQRLPGWQPVSHLDAGAGPGTALWAASSVWQQIAAYTALERDGNMIALGKRLAACAPAPLHSTQWLQTDLTGQWDAPSHSLVTASYVLGELAVEQAASLIHKLWDKTGDVLVLIEPGTPAGFATILQARSLLLSLGASIAAPCPQDGPCPLSGDWCHFSQRVARSRLHRQVKGAELGYEDEKFSYLVVTKLKSTPITARVLRHPLIRKGYVCLKLCTPGGLLEKTFSRRDGELYQKAKDLRWGDKVD